MEKPNFFAATLFLFLLAAQQHAAQPPAFFPANQLDFAISTSQGYLAPDSIVFLQYSTSSSRNYSTVLAVKQNGTATLYTASNVTDASFTYDDPSTPAVDGVWQGQLEEGGVLHNVYLQSIADVAGLLTSQNGSVLPYVNVELLCSDGIARNATTSENGAFSFSRVRAGKCIISASENGQSIRQDFQLSQGDFASLGLQLKSPDNSVSLLLALFVAVLVAVWKYGRKPRQPNGKVQKRKKPSSASSFSIPSAPNPRQLDLLATLDPKEKGIVEYVAHKSPSAVRVSKVRRDLLIPKTSLTRTLQALERKQFLRIEKVGSRMFVKLHEFFIKV